MMPTPWHRMASNQTVKIQWLQNTLIGATKREHPRNILEYSNTNRAIPIDNPVISLRPSILREGILRVDGCSVTLRTVSRRESNQDVWFLRSWHRWCNPIKPCQSLSSKEESSDQYILKISLEEEFRSMTPSSSILQVELNLNPNGTLYDRHHEKDEHVFGGGLSWKWRGTIAPRSI